MKNKLLSLHEGAINNIGDYIQALAASQFFPSIDGFINREELSEYDGDDCKVIMNGWFMHHPENWPPSDKIHPLFVAFHINKTVREQLLSDKSIEYFKKYEPIGCRDNYTCNLLKEKGVDAFFSGCLTLTLGNTYYSNVREDKCYFVDPVIPRHYSFSGMVKDIVAIIKYNRTVSAIASKSRFGSSRLKNYFLSARFLRYYAACFEVESIRNAEFVNQESSYYTSRFNSDEARLQEAERLIKLYSKAKFVVTSRIHCALPCLGLNTPVYFIHNVIKDDEVSSCRYDGLIELFNVIQCSSKRLTPQFPQEGRLSLNNIVYNKRSWEPLSESLTNKCREFTSN